VVLIWQRRPFFVRIVTAVLSKSPRSAIAGSVSTEPDALSHSASSPSAHRIQRNTSRSWISMSRKTPTDCIDVLRPAGARVTAGDDEHLGVADLAAVHAGAGFVEGGVEAALEADHAGHAGRLHRFTAGNGARHRQVHRLLAEDVLAGGGGAGDQVGVGGGGRGDGDHVDRRVGQHGLDGRDLRAELLGERAGAVADRVADELELHARQVGEVGGVDAADATGTEDGDVFHGVPGGRKGQKMGRRDGGLGIEL